MRLSALCYGCVYCRQCDKEQEQKCRNLDYALFTTDEQKQMCQLMCGGIEEDDTEMD